MPDSVLYAILQLTHSKLDMTDRNSERLKAVLAEVFSQDDRTSEVLAESPVYSGSLSILRDRVFFGSFHNGFSLSCWRNAHDELHVTIETESHGRLSEATDFAIRQMLSALRQAKLSPRFKSLEVMPVGDTSPILHGRVGLIDHLLDRLNVQQIGAAFVTAVVFALGGALLWDDTKYLWIGSVPVLALGCFSLVDALISRVTRKVRWYVK